jgi:hypothetical protein
MDRIDFYKFSIKEYPNHKDKDSLIFSVNELQKELESSFKYIDYLEDNKGDEKIIRELITDYDYLNKIISLGRTYWNNPKNCKGCINHTVTIFGETCSLLKINVISSSDFYKHPKCHVS